MRKSVRKGLVALRGRSAAVVFAFMLMCFPLVAPLAQDRPTLDLLDVLDTVQAENADIRSAGIELESARSGYESARAGVGPQVDLELEPYSISERRSDSLEQGGSPGQGDSPEQDDGPEGASTQNGSAPGGDNEATTGVDTGPTTTRKQSTAATLRFSQQLPTGGNVSADGTLEASASTELDDDGDDNADPAWEVAPSAGLRLSQPVFVGGRFVDVRIGRALDREARTGVRNAQVAQEEAANGSLIAAVELYFAISDVRQSVDTLELSRDILSRRIEETESDVEAGVASERQLLEVRLQRNRTRETLLDLRDQLRGFERSFARLVAGEFDPSEYTFERASELEADIEAQAQDILDRYDGVERSEWDVSENSGVRRARISVEQARDQAITAAPDRAAEFSVTGNASRRYPDEREDETDVIDAFGDLLDEDGGFDWNLTLGLTVPLYDGGRRRNEALADTRSIELAELERQEAEDDARDDLADELERLEILIERAEILRADSDFEADSLADTRALAEIDEATGLEVEEVQRDLRESDNAVNEALTDMLLTILDIERIRGKLVMDEVSTRFLDGNE
ncbi:MAG: TolC family protein [Spirochaetales bacterium]